MKPSTKDRLILCGFAVPWIILAVVLTMMVF